MDREPHLRVVRVAEDAEFLRAARAGSMVAAVEEFGAYLRSQEKHVEPAQRDDLVAVRAMWFEAMGDLLDVP